MAVLDELRKMVREDMTDRLRYAKTEFIATEAAVKVIDAFEAAHPNLTECSITSCAAHKDATP